MLWGWALIALAIALQSACLILFKRERDGAISGEATYLWLTLCMLLAGLLAVAALPAELIRAAIAGFVLLTMQIPGSNEIERSTRRIVIRWVSAVVCLPFIAFELWSFVGAHLAIQ